MGAADQLPVSTLRGKVRRDIYVHPGRTLDIVDVHSDRHRSKPVDTKLVRLGHPSSDSHGRVGDASGSSVPLEAGVGESSAGMDPETLGCSIGLDVESS